VEFRYTVLRSSASGDQLALIPAVSGNAAIGQLFSTPPSLEKRLDQLSQISAQLSRPECPSAESIPPHERSRPRPPGRPDHRTIPTAPPRLGVPWVSSTHCSAGPNRREPTSTTSSPCPRRGGPCRRPPASPRPEPAPGRARSSPG